jgi:hypothetical protein
VANAGNLASGSVLARSSGQRFEQLEHLIVRREMIEAGRISPLLAARGKLAGHRPADVSKAADGSRHGFSQIWAVVVPRSEELSTAIPAAGAR